MTTHKAKQIIKAELGILGLNNAMTAKTVDFTDLARDKAIFVTIRGWRPSPSAGGLRQVAHRNGFCLEFEG